MTAHLQLVGPSNENRSVRARRQTPTRPRNRDLRPREYLTPSEVETLIRTARKGRHGHRDATLILVAYRHGLRAIEICDLEWSQVELIAPPRCTFAGLRMANRLPIRSAVTSCARSESCSATPAEAMSSKPSEAPRSLRTPSIA